jgi:GMP synthase (glutamine-hydrolysing)
VNDRGRLLYLENSAGSNDHTHVADRLRALGFDVEIARAHRGEFPTDLETYDAAYLTGSPHGAYDDVPWIHREHDVIRRIAAGHIPMLGVCFGSQILASALSGRDQVFRRDACEVGYASLPLSDAARQDPLMTGVANPIRMFVWHNDEVRDAHPSMTILASSAECPNQIWRYGDEPIWGIQGHPEVTPATARAFLEEHRATLERDGADVDGLLRDPGSDRDVDRFLENFARLVREQRASRRPSAS